MPSSPELPKIGEALGERFELRQILGEGGMGVVYDAFDRRTKEPCAVKVLFPFHCDKPQLVARFDREARVTARLQGKHVVRVLDVGALPTGVRYLAMERLHGRDVAKELEEHGRVPVEKAVEIVLQAAEAMHEAHRAGIIHRDLKPENLFLLDEERTTVKVLDFGISRLLEGDEKLTTDYAPLGTAFYMSPEQIEHASRVDKRTDIWSLGVVLYEMLVGRVPFDGEGTGILVSIATRPVPPPSTFVEDLPRGLEDVVMRALEKSPDARYASMEAFARALTPWAPATSATSFGRRGRWRFLWVAALAAAAVAAGTLAWLRIDPRSLFAHHEDTEESAPESASASASTSAAPSAPSASTTAARRPLPPRGTASPKSKRKP